MNQNNKNNPMFKIKNGKETLLINNETDSEQIADIDGVDKFVAIGNKAKTGKHKNSSKLIFYTKYVLIPILVGLFVLWFGHEMEWN
ncbi:hypothetical protein ACQKOC_22160 [Enterobacter mori]|uniref:hypothetical protein n=1 Tax=Enterobacter mori TaxID=539813 RepID=UPI003D02E337